MFLQYFNQILTAILEVLDDPDSSVKEHALLLISEMFRNQVSISFFNKILICFGCSPLHVFLLSHIDLSNGSDIRKMPWKILLKF